MSNVYEIKGGIDSLCSGCITRIGALTGLFYNVMVGDTIKIVDAPSEDVEEIQAIVDVLYDAGEVAVVTETTQALIAL